MSSTLDDKKISIIDFWEDCVLHSLINLGNLILQLSGFSLILENFSKMRLLLLLHKQIVFYFFFLESVSFQYILFGILIKQTLNFEIFEFTITELASINLDVNRFNLMLVDSKGHISIFFNLNIQFSFLIQNPEESINIIVFNTTFNWNVKNLE